MKGSVEKSPGRRARGTTWLAWGLFALYVALAVLTVALVAFHGGSTDEVLGVLAIGYATVGALVASRQPANAVGWLMLTIALAFGLQTVADAYMTRSASPGASATGWLSSWVWLLWLYSAAFFLPLVFPNGRLLSRRWRVVAALGAVILVTGIVGAAFASGPLDIESDAPIRNPLGVGGAPGEVVDALARLSDPLAAIGILLAGVSLALRLHRSRGRERQQVKWFAYVAALAIVGLLMAFMEVLAGGTGSPQWVTVVGGIGWGSALLLILIGIPLAVGTAMLRHRLYDIDVVIKRTLVYAALTATLGASYVGMVLVLAALTPLTRDSGLAIAASTLAVAALFGPARARIQAVVDRRFYRQRYDAARTLEAFSARLRDELDLEALGADLRGVVHDTVQPAHVSLWLREVPR